MLLCNCSPGTQTGVLCFKVWVCVLQTSHARLQALAAEGGGQKLGKASTPLKHTRVLPGHITRPLFRLKGGETFLPGMGPAENGVGQNLILNLTLIPDGVQSCQHYVSNADAVHTVLKGLEGWKVWGVGAFPSGSEMALLSSVCVLFQLMRS